MKAATAGLINIIGPNGPSQLYLAECFDLTLRDGTVLHYTTWPKDLTISGTTYKAGPPFLWASKLTQSVGTSSDSITLTILGRDTDLVEGIPIFQALAGGLFSGATFLQKRFLMASPGDTSNGAIIWFGGRLGPVNQLTRSKATVKVDAHTILLRNQSPGRLLQASCPATLFDSLCTLNRAAFKTSNAVVAGSTMNKILTTLGQADGYFTQGSIKFTSGVNVGVMRPVKLYASGNVFLGLKLDQNVSAGDTFDIYPGCDKTQATCNTKFSNLINFAGTPYVPVPETAI